MPEDKIINISITSIVPSDNQPRKNFDEKTIDNLANSIKQYGILNPILVRPHNGTYEIIAGERRYRAAKKLGLSVVPVIIKPIDDLELSEIALIENIMRENLTPIEEATAYKEILETSSINESTLAQKLGKTQSTISNKIRLLSLPPEVQKALNEKKISERHARTLLQLKNSSEQINYLNRIISDKLTVKELEELIKNNISDEETINTTIQSIMNSIKKDNINKKEEKESDNMNQGNFFPNFNQPTPNTQNNENTNPLTTPEPMPNLTPLTPNTQNMATTQPSFAMPSFNSTPTAPNNQMTNEPQNNINNIPQFTNNNPTPNDQIVPNVEPLFTPTIDTPLPNNQNPYVPEVENTNSLPTPTISSTPEPAENNIPTTPIIEDIPLFNNITANQQTPTDPTPAYEIPVSTSTQETNNNQPLVPENTTTPVETTPDNLNKTKEFLENNNIPYKLYSNSTGHCIIIEL